MKFPTKLIGTLLALSICACSNEFLDKQNPTQLGEETFYNTEVQVHQAVIGIYSQLQGVIADHWLFQEFITDNTTVHFNEGNSNKL